MNKAIELPYFRLVDFPEDDPYLRGLKMKFLSGALEGETFSLHWVRESIVTIDNSLDGRDLDTMLEKVEVGAVAISASPASPIFRMYSRNNMVSRIFSTESKPKQASLTGQFQCHPKNTGGIFLFSWDFAVKIGEILLTESCSHELRCKCAFLQ